MRFLKSMVKTKLVRGCWYSQTLWMKKGQEVGQEVTLIAIRELAQEVAQEATQEAIQEATREENEVLVNLPITSSSYRLVHCLLAFHFFLLFPSLPLDTFFSMNYTWRIILLVNGLCLTVIV